MPLVYACIAPHGGEIVPALAGDKLKLFGPTRKAMRELGRRIKVARPDTVVIASPHNLRLPKHIGVVISENSSGSVAAGKREIKLKAKCDIKLAGRVIADAEGKRLPVAGANYGALRGHPRTSQWTGGR
jgi:aromatic ring-opening dioxygenase LigB subunit